MQSYGSGKKGPVCKEDNYVTFRDRNVGQIFEEQLGKTPEFRKSDVLRGANLSKGKNVSEENMNPHSFEEYSFNGGDVQKNALGERESDGEKNKNDMGSEMINGGKFLGGKQRGRPPNRHRNKTGNKKLKRSLGWVVDHWYHQQCGFRSDKSVTALSETLGRCYTGDTWKRIRKVGQRLGVRLAI